MDSGSPTVEELIDLLDLKPLPDEGGFFKETYRLYLSGESLDLNKSKALTTAIYYLITESSFSHLHRLRSDEIYHFYTGDAVELVTITEDGSLNVHELGSAVHRKQTPQLVVKKETWQGSRLKEGGRFALLGCTVSPGFDFADYEHGERSLLLSKFPQHEKTILRYTS